jgi:hypothetical protein
MREKSYKFDKEREDPFRARLRFLWRTRHKLTMRTKPAKRNAHSSITLKRSYQNQQGKTEPRS